MELETNIGLEIHAELSTKTKAFCSCKVEFGGEPNSRCCPVCMGFPGALPVLNEELVKSAIKMGIATNCTINKTIKNARKNYFYPDLPKGYQISQSIAPVCSNGFIVVNNRKIRINRIHIEEDAGKLIHEGDKTKIDYNRAGVPLIEIVTEPDILTSNEAKIFLNKIKSLLLYLNISECKMQEGNLRCDVNVSVREKGATEYNARCEMKNINSFSAVLHCIEYETKRQKELFLNGEKIYAETRRWDEEKGMSFPMRGKEGAADYRYFPEPDIPCVHIKDDLVEEIRETLPELPEDKKKRYIEKFGLSEIDAENIAKKKHFTELLEDAIKMGAEPKVVANWLLGTVSKLVNKNGENIPFDGKDLAKLYNMISGGLVSQNVVSDIFEIVFNTGNSLENVVKENNFTNIDDAQKLRDVAKEVVLSNEKSVNDYKKGKTNAFGYLMGQCMKKCNNRANPEALKKILEEML